MIIDDLNPLYVYESKLSLFTRMSQTRAGAEKLLDAQVIPLLAKCDYLDARPEADQTFIGISSAFFPFLRADSVLAEQDSFLPSAVHRYHQLFMPALQVVGGILATLGNRHTTATNQVHTSISRLNV